MPTAADYLMQGPDAERYYAQTELKHFSPAATGSVFDDPRATTITELLDLAIAQRGSLEGDDHDILGQPDRAGTYYVSVEVRGATGVLSARDLNKGEAVLVKRTKEGVPPDFIVLGRPRQETQMATIVMVDEMLEGRPTGRRVLLTCHPGKPAPRAGEHRSKLKDNTVLSKSELSPAETILLGSLDTLGGTTEEVLEVMLGYPIASGTDAQMALNAIAAAEGSVRAQAQEVLYDAVRLEEGYYDFSSDAMSTMLMDRAAELHSDLALETAATGRTIPAPRPDWGKLKEDLARSSSVRSWRK